MIPLFACLISGQQVIQSLTINEISNTYHISMIIHIQDQILTLKWHKPITMMDNRIMIIRKLKFLTITARPIRAMSALKKIWSNVTLCLHEYCTTLLFCHCVWTVLWVYRNKCSVNNTSLSKWTQHNNATVSTYCLWNWNFVTEGQMNWTDNLGTKTKLWLAYGYRLLNPKI